MDFGVIDVDTPFLKLLVYEFNALLPNLWGKLAWPLSYIEASTTTFFCIGIWD